jgi:hypothetical protein
VTDRRGDSRPLWLPAPRPGGEARVGGHWLSVVEHTPTRLIVHDPFGVAHLVSGAMGAGTARFCRYVRCNFGRRWMVG